MKKEGLKVPSLIFVIGLVLALVAYLITSIAMAPTVTQEDFHYSASYRLNGETKTLEGVYRVSFASVGEGIDPLERYYEGYYPAEPEAGDPKAHLLEKKDDLELRIVFIFTDDYLMGDGDGGDEVYEPYLAVYDQEGCEYSDPEMLDKFDAELISWEMPEPIENSFVFIKFAPPHGGSMTAVLFVGLLVLLACALFVKKEPDVSYGALDKISILTSWVIGLGALPFMTLVAYLMQTYMGGDDFFYQIDLLVPPITAFTLAASLVLRRKGRGKIAFILPFAGPILFVLIMLLESIV